MSPAPIQAAAIEQWPVVDDCVAVGGMPLPRLAQRVGRTPFYAYDRQRLTARVQLLRKHLPREVKVHYAMKANPMPALVCHMRSLVDGIDVASGRELGVALDTGMDPLAISFAGPGKSDAEIAQAIAAGILLNVESWREVESAARWSRELQLPARVAVRINPAFELKASGMKMGGGPKPFGVDAEEVPALLRDIADKQLAFEGFHIYSGSQNLSADSIGEAQRKTVELAIDLAGVAPSPVRALNIGGGFGIPYFPGDKPLDVARVGENLRGLVGVVQSKLPQAELIVELGRYLVGEAGLYVCRVVDRKVSRGHTFLVTDGGLHHHLAASGNFGQVIRKNYPVCIGNRVAKGPRSVVSVVGPLCTPLDILADHLEMADAEPGDLVVVFQSGAYGATASPRDFLSHPDCLEALV